MVISLAIRFVPSLLIDSQRIIRAQASRGVDFTNGNLKTKSKALVSLFIPMFVTAFKKADDLANAMDTRAYDPRKLRSHYRKYNITIFDVALFSIVLMLTSFFITLCICNIKIGVFS
jgi:energy-coupling factor transport system permease protein